MGVSQNFVSSSKSEVLNWGTRTPQAKKKIELFHNIVLFWDAALFVVCRWNDSAVSFDPGHLWFCRNSPEWLDPGEVGASGRTRPQWFPVRNDTQTLTWPPQTRRDGDRSARRRHREKQLQISKTDKVSRLYLNQTWEVLSHTLKLIFNYSFISLEHLTVKHCQIPYLSFYLNIALLCLVV